MGQNHGKSNAPQNIKNKTKNNYFTQAIQRCGKDFVNTANIQQLQYDAPRIFRDLAKGAVDIAQCQEYLMNERLATVLEQQALQTYIYNSEIFNSIDYRINGMAYNQQPVDQYIIALREEWKCRVAVYQIIHYNIQNFRVTKDVNFILAMAAQIANNRRYI